MTYGGARFPSVKCIRHVSVNNFQQVLQRSDLDWSWSGRRASGEASGNGQSPGCRAYARRNDIMLLKISHRQQTEVSTHSKLSPIPCLARFGRLQRFSRLSLLVVVQATPCLIADSAAAQMCAIRQKSRATRSCQPGRRPLPIILFTSVIATGPTSSTSLPTSPDGVLLSEKLQKKNSRKHLSWLFAMASLALTYGAELSRMPASSGRVACWRPAVPSHGLQQLYQC